MAEVRSYRDLLVWQRAMDLLIRCYEVAAQLPLGEKYSLVSEIQRTALNVPSNIANGHGIGITNQYTHYLAMAHGCLMRLETLFHAAERLKFLPPEVVASLLQETAEIGRMLNGLMRNLRS